MESASRFLHRCPRDAGHVTLSRHLVYVTFGAQHKAERSIKFLAARPAATLYCRPSYTGTLCKVTSYIVRLLLLLQRRSVRAINSLVVKATQQQQRYKTRHRLRSRL